MTQPAGSPRFSEYQTVGEAAEFLGVSTATLRNWDRAGKLKPRRHPQNGYRIYLHEDLEAVLKSVNRSQFTEESFAPTVDWSEMAETEHFVQFYENDAYLMDSVSAFVAAALTDGEGSVVIATPAHRIELQRKLLAAGVDVSETMATGRFVMLDAAETLSKFMMNGSPDSQRFTDSVGSVIAQMSEGVRRIHAFGEMVALLWGDGNRDAAIRLEELWNELAKSHRFALFCAYPITGFGEESDSVPFSGVCKCHSRVIPSESYAAIPEPQERIRAITLLQQKAQSLSAEISHRTEVERSLSQRERELADFFENATEGLHKVGPDGTILWANKAECNLLGYSVAEYVGRPFADFHADAEVAEEILGKLRKGETLENYPARLRCKDGSIKHVLINSSACFENGEFAYTRCFTRDVTRQWHAEKALRDADHRKDEFLATLAHELRNPLAPLRNSLEILRRNDCTKEIASDARSAMERQVVQMTRLVDDLLDVSRITRDKIELRKERLNLATILNAAVETSRPLLDAAGHKLTINLPTNPIFLNADPTRLAQVFSNLLNNSAKYTEAGGHIQLSAEQQGRDAVITVQDNGIGIPCDELAYVFDMFRQVDQSLNRAQGGLGIGLTLVRRLVELHDGTVNAQSEGAGKGASFVVRLPVAKAAPERIVEIPQKRGSAEISKRRILVVDDNRDSADTLSMLLRMKGNDVRTMGDGLEAVEAVESFLPEIILMDVGMPKLNGYDATRRIRQMPCGKEIYIVAVTGWGQATDVRKAVEAGCSAHLVKPVDYDALERLLTSLKPKSV
jgi:PAS domain S-box-containing protein